MSEQLEVTEGQAGSGRRRRSVPVDTVVSPDRHPGRRQLLSVEETSSSHSDTSLSPATWITTLIGATALLAVVVAVIALLFRKN